MSISIGSTYESEPIKISLDKALSLDLSMIYSYVSNKSEKTHYLRYYYDALTKFAMLN